MNVWKCTVLDLGLVSSRDFRALPPTDVASVLVSLDSAAVAPRAEDCFLDSVTGDTLEFVVVQEVTRDVCFSTAAAEVTLLLENSRSDS